MSPSFLHELDGILAKDKDGLVEHLKDFFRKRVETIERKLTGSYPCRGQLLCDTFAAPRHGKYSLSVPVFFAQADGIFWERFLKSLFISEERKCAVSNYGTEPNNDQKQLKRIARARSTDSLHKELVRLLGNRNAKDAWHIRTADVHGLFCFLTMDFKLRENIEQKKNIKPL